MSFHGEQSDENENDPKPLSAEQLRAERDALRERANRAEQEAARERARVDSWLANRSDPIKNPEPAAPPPMPDPAEDPDAYRRWHAEDRARQQREIEKRFDSLRNEVRTDVASAETRAALWQTFQQRYPKHAQQTRLAGIAFAAVAERGLDSDAVRVADAVKAEMEAIAGPLSSGGADRTGGLTGGEPPRKTQQRQAEGGDEPIITMHEAITKRKIAHGFM